MSSYRYCCRKSSPHPPPPLLWPLPKPAYFIFIGPYWKIIQNNDMMNSVLGITLFHIREYKYCVTVPVVCFMIFFISESRSEVCGGKWCLLCNKMLSCVTFLQFLNESTTPIKYYNTDWTSKLLIFIFIVTP